jgi:hypothetical protein
VRVIPCFARVSKASVEAAVFDEARQRRDDTRTQRTHGKVGVLQPDLYDPVERLALARRSVLERAIREARIVGRLYERASRGGREALRCGGGSQVYRGREDEYGGEHDGRGRSQLRRCRWAFVKLLTDSPGLCSRFRVAIREICVL